MTRRALVVGTSVAITTRPLWSVAGAAAAAPAIASRPMFTGGFPRTFVFRQCEVLAQLRSYPEWAASFEGFSGLEMKALPEERTDTVTSRNLAYANRWKREHPDAVALLHYNGIARRPDYRTQGWYAGDWMHFAGATVLGAVDASATELVVDDADQFEAPVGRYGEVGADLVLTGRTPEGLPDWSVAEQLLVTAVDQDTGTLSVDRGRYGTTPLSLDAGAYVARHVTRGPWSAQDSRLWAYNFSTRAPRGPDGLSVAERIATQMGQDFGPSGALRRFDGVQLDVFTIRVRPAELADLDLDGDGTPDGGYDGSTNTYVAGQADYLRRLRTTLGPNRVVLTDGGEVQTADRAVSAGIEIEGFPRLREETLAFWSTAVSSLEYWSVRGRAPRLSYPLAKTYHELDAPTDFARFRSTLAASLLCGTQFAFWDEPGGTSLDGLKPPPYSGNFPDTFTVWDELLDDAGLPAGWLGQPTWPPVWLAPQGADVLQGAGVTMPASWVSGLVASGATLRRPPARAELDLTPVSATDPFSVTCTVPDAPTGDVVVRVELATRADPAYPVSVPRLLELSIATRRAQTSDHLVDTAYRPVRAYSRRLAAGDLAITLTVPAGPGVRLRHLEVFRSADAGYREFEHGAVFVNPGLEPVTFDTSGLGSLVRLSASAGQDPATNDGTPVGATLTVPPTDALVVRRIRM